MNDPDLIHWANSSQSEFVRGFAFRLIAKRMYKKGMLHSTIEYATQAMKEYPENCTIFSQIRQDMIKYQFSLLIYEQNSPNEESDINSEFGCEIKKIQKYAVERVSITVENQNIYALLKSNCDVPVIDKEWAAGLKSCFLVKEFGLEWGIIKIYQNQIPYQINGLLGDIFTTTGFNLILP